MIFEIKQVEKDYHSAAFSAFKDGEHIGQFNLTGKFGSRDMHVTGILIDTPFFMSCSENVNTKENIRPYTILNGIRPIGMISQILDDGFTVNNFIYNEIELNGKTYSQYSVALGPGDVKFILYENKKQIALVERDNTEKGLNFRVYAENKNAAILSVISIIYIYITSVYKPSIKHQHATLLFSRPFGHVMAERFDEEFKKKIKE